MRREERLSAIAIPGGRRGLGSALLVFALAFVVYALLTSRDLAWVDSVEFTLAGASLGIPHPPGYPLYTLLVRLAGAAALGPALAANLLSALAGAAACGVGALLGAQLGLRPSAAAAGGLVLAFSRELLAQATVAEVYTLHLLLIALLLFIGFAQATAQDEIRPRLLVLIAFLFGLGLAHHLTIVLALPALLVLLATRRNRQHRRHRRSSAIDRARFLIVAAAAFILPLTLYILLPLRSLADPVLDQGDPETLPRLLAHATGRQFGYRLLTSETAYVWGELGRFFHLLAEQWTPAHLALAALGAVAILRRPGGWHQLLALFLLASASVAYAVEYRIPDKGGYYLPAYLVTALLFAAGADLLSMIAPPRRWGRVLAGLLLVALPLAPALAHLKAADRHADHSLRDLTLEVTRRTTPGSLIVSDDTNYAFALLYLQAIEGKFEDREVVSQYLLPLPWYADRMAHVDARLPAEVAAAAADRRGLRGRALGDRQADDARRLADRLARRALAERDVFFYFHHFEEDKRSFESLVLVDRGLVYQVKGVATEASSPSGDQEEGGVPDARFERRAAYEAAARRQTPEERAVARRFAAASNRAGIARVRRGDLAGAEAEFSQALAFDPRYAQAWLNLGLLTADYLGHKDLAVHAWRTYLELTPDAPEAANVRARLAAIEGGGNAAKQK